MTGKLSCDGEVIPDIVRTKPQTAQPGASFLVTLPIYPERAVVFLYSMTTSDRRLIDRLDAALIELLAAEPRVGVLEASRRLGVARGTVQARLDRMREYGVITGYGARRGSGRARL